MGVLQTEEVFSASAILLTKSVVNWRKPKKVLSFCSIIDNDINNHGSIGIVARGLHTPETSANIVCHSSGVETFTPVVSKTNSHNQFPVSYIRHSLFNSKNIITNRIVGYYSFAIE